MEKGDKCVIADPDQSRTKIWVYNMFAEQISKQYYMDHVVVTFLGPLKK